MMPRDLRLIRRGTKNRPRCYGCGREIQKGNEHRLPDGHIYGESCAARRMEQINNDPQHLVQDRFI